MAQTAVEQLVNYMKENYHLTEETLYEFEQAKQMERAQIESAYEQGDIQLVNAQQYYTQTYSTQLQNETN